MRRGEDISPASLAKELGVTPATVYAWEAGTKAPSDDSLERLAELFAVTRAWLRYGEGPKELPQSGPIPPEYLNHDPVDGGRDGMAAARELEARREAERRATESKRRKRGA